MKMINLKKKISIGNIVLGTILILWGILIFYPFYNAILVSFMSHSEYMRKPFALFVSKPTLDAYKQIFSNPLIWSGYKSTLIILLFKLPISLIICCSMGYALSRKPFLFSKTVNNLAVLTMYFSGGIIPMYLLIREYGLMGSYASVIIVGLFSAYDMILVKNFFYGIPDTLEESAKLDGANDLIIFFKIYMPLAKPIIATVSLFFAVGIWNEWYHPMLFISDNSKWTLQLVLREIISNAASIATEESMLDEEMLGSETFALNVQMASIIVTMLPIMIVYPFLQKNFMSGLTLGAVKG